MRERLDEAAVLKMLDEQSAGNRTAWGHANGLSKTYVFDVLCGRRPINAAILKALGLERVSYFQKLEENEDG